MKKYFGISSLMLMIALAINSFGNWDGPNSIEIPVRPTEIDVKGHVNNAKYIEYLQWSRWEWFDRKGLTNDAMAEMDTVFVVANININYRREVRYGDILKTSVEVDSVGEKSVTLDQKIYKSDGSLAADAKVVLVAIDPNIRKSRLLPDAIRKVISNDSVVD